MYHRAGRITASIAGELYKTNIDITSQSLLNKIMQYTEVTKNRSTRFGTNTEPLAREYYKNTQKLNHKNLTLKQCSFLIKYTHTHTLVHHLTTSFHAHATMTMSLKLSVLIIIKMNLNTGEMTKGSH